MTGSTTTPTTGPASPTAMSTTPTSASSTTSTSSPPGSAPPQHLMIGNVGNPAVRCDQLAGHGRVLHADPVEPSLGAADHRGSYSGATPCSGWSSSTSHSATVIAFWIGHPLIRRSASATSSRTQPSATRSCARDAAEAVGFYRGEDAERGLLRTRFAAIIANYRRFVNRTIALTGWNLSMSQIINPLPCHPGAATVQRRDRSWRCDSVVQRLRIDSRLPSRSSETPTIRLPATERRSSVFTDWSKPPGGPAAPKLETQASTDGSVELRQVEVRTPSGAQLVEPLDLRLSRARRWITGPSERVRRPAAQPALLWPHASGTLCRPIDEHDTMFLSADAVRPLGDLRTVVSYPASSGDIDDQDLQHVLTKVALAHLAIRLGGPGLGEGSVASEQQRIAFARVLLTKPKAVFLDESTSALDEGLSSRCTTAFAPNCRTPSWSASATVRRSSSITSRSWELFGRRSLAAGHLRRA